MSLDEWIDWLELEDEVLRLCREERMELAELLKELQDRRADDDRDND